jgi:hypothetical protein
MGSTMPLPRHDELQFETVIDAQVPYAPRWITFGAPVVRGVGKRIDDPRQMARLWELSEC